MKIEKHKILEQLVTESVFDYYLMTLNEIKEHLKQFPEASGYISDAIKYYGRVSPSGTKKVIGFLDSESCMDVYYIVFDAQDEELSFWLANDSCVIEELETWK